MAQYDGSIRINTQINIKQAQINLATLENRIAKTSDKIASLRAKMDALKNAKIPTQEYKEVQSQIENTKKKIDDLVEKQNRFLATGGKETSSAYKRMEYDLEKLKKTLPYLQEKLQDLVDTGKAFTLGENTEEYSKLGKQLKYAENELSSLSKRHDVLSEKQRVVSGGYEEIGNKGRESFQRINGYASKTGDGLKKISGQTKKVAVLFASTIGKSTTQAIGSLNTLTNSVKKLGSVITTVFMARQIAQFGKEALEAASDMEAVESQFAQVFGNLADEASKSLSEIANQSGILEDRMKGSYTKIAAFAKTTGMDTADSLNLANRAMVAVADSAAFYDRSLEETTESLQSFLKGNYENDAALGLSATEYTRNAAANKLYGKSFIELSEAQKQLTLLQMVEDANALSGALGQAAREADTWTNQIGNLSQAWKNLKANLGKLVLPVAIQAVKMITNVINALNAMLAKLSTAAGAFRSFSELLTGKKSQAGTGVTGASQDTIPALGEDYNTAASGAENLASATEDAAEATKEAEKAAEGYLSPLDEINKIGKQDIEVPEIEKVKDKVGDTGGAGGAGNVAGVPVDYGELAKGQTAIDELSDKFSGLYDLIKKKDWEGLGRSMASGINTGLRKIYDALDWNKIGPKITKTTDAFTRTVNSMVENIDWDLMGRVIGRGINLLAKTFNQLTDPKTGINFEAIGRSLSTALRGMLVEVDWRELGNAIGNYFMISWNLFKGFVDDMWRTSDLTSLNGWQELGRSLADGVAGLFEKINFKQIGISVGKGLSGVFEIVRQFALDMETNGTWDFMGTSIAKGINHALSNIKWKTALSAARNMGTGIAKTINQFVSKANFKLIGRTISNALKTAFRFAATLIGKTDFKTIGDKIGDLLVGIELFSVLGGLAETIYEAIKGAFEALSGIFETAPLEASLISAFAILKFTGVGKSVAGNIASAIGDSIETSMINSGFASSLQTGIAKAATGAVAAFAEFSVIKNSFEDLASGTSSFIDEIGKIGGAAVTAGVAMTTVFGFPAGLIATAFAGLMGAFAGVISANDELAQKMKEEEEISRYGQTISDMTDEIDRSTKAIEERIGESDAFIKTAGIAEFNMAKDLADRYFELADKQGRTNEETEEMKTLASLLVDTMPELSQYYDEQTGLLDATKGKIDELIQSRLQEIKLNAIEEQLTQAYKDQADALANVEKMAAPVNDAQAHMNELQEKYNELSDKTKLLEEYEQLSAKIQNCDGDTEALLEKQAELENKLTSGGSEEFPTFASLDRELIDASQNIVDFKDEYDRTMQSFAEADETYNAVGENISRLTEMYTSGLENSAKEGIAAHNRAMEDDTSMQSAAVESARRAVSGAVQETKTGWDNSKESIKSSVKDALVDGFSLEDELKGKYSGYAAFSVEGYNSKIKELEGEAKTTMESFAQKGIMDPFTNKLGIHSPSTIFSGYGSNIVSGLKSGINNDWDSFSDWWGTKVSNILDKFKGIKKSFEEKGNEIISGIQTGVSEKWSELSDALTGKKNDIVNTFSNIREEMKNIGSNIISGIIDGLYSMWNNLTSWVSSIKDMLTFNISSPFGGGGSYSVNTPIAYAGFPDLSNVPIPHLAQGTVIPPNKEFLAVLGDQKRGTNIEAPLETIKQAQKESLMEVLSQLGITGGNKGGAPQNITLQVLLDGKVLGQTMVDWGRIQQMSTGKNPYALGNT